MIINSRALVALLLMTLTACTSDSTVKSENPADVHLQLGVRYLSLNKLEVAKENLLKALAIEPNNVQAHNALAFFIRKVK